MSEEGKFSYQFSQRWLATPQKVRDAIVHELEDIIKLLDNDTELDSFEFRQPDLPTYIDQVYAEAEQQKIQAQLEAQQQAELEAQQLAAIQAEELAQKAQQQDNAADVQQDEDDKTASAEFVEAATQDDPTDAAPDSHDVHIEQQQDTTVQQSTVNDDDGDNIAVQATTTDTENTQHIDPETLINELETRIDDYLSEQMAQLSEDLKSWLRDEVKRHLNKQ